MIRSLSLRNFTVFTEADLRLSPQLNVIHGVNGLGKTHLLKLAYAVAHALTHPPATAAESAPSKATLGALLAEELFAVFRPDKLGRIARRTQGKTRAVVAVDFGTNRKLTFDFHTNSSRNVNATVVPGSWLTGQSPIYLPTREVLSIYPGFVSAYEANTLEFDRTWRDLCALLGRRSVPPGKRPGWVDTLLRPLEDAMAAKVVLDASGRFYLASQHDSVGRIEMHLVAEGMRKLAMLAQLVANRTLSEHNLLIWDEPEANLNPQIVRQIARTLCELARRDVQVVIATHSLFLMREIHILRETVFKDAFECRFFGLHREADGAVKVMQGDQLEATGDVVALDEDLQQAETYIDVETGAWKDRP